MRGSGVEAFPADVANQSSSSREWHSCRGCTQHLPNQAPQPHICVDAAPLPPCSLVHGHAGQQLQLVGGLHGGDSRGQTHG